MWIFPQSYSLGRGIQVSRLFFTHIGEHFCLIWELQYHFLKLFLEIISLWTWFSSIICPAWKVTPPKKPKGNETKMMPTEMVLKLPPLGLWPETWPPVVEKVALSVRGITDISSQLRLSSWRIRRVREKWKEHSCSHFMIQQMPCLHTT